MNRKAWISVAIVVVAVLALAAAFQFWRSDADSRKKPAPPVKPVLGMGWNPANANVFIAKQMGYFRDQGFDVTLQPYPAGRLALAALIEGKIDLAVVPETPIVFAALAGARFSVLATLCVTGTNTVMIGRRDRGVEKPSDLAGKKLGTVSGTYAQFAQDTILAMHKVDPRSIVLINLTAPQTVDALMAGEVDAVTTWAPYSFELKTRLGNAAAVFGDETMQTTTYNLLARDELRKQHPEVVRGMLAALLRASDLARSDPARAVREVAQAAGLDEAVVKAEWNSMNLGLALNQTLLVAMEDQARWAIRQRLVEASTVPSFREWIHVDALAAVKPDAVSVIK